MILWRGNVRIQKILEDWYLNIALHTIILARGELKEHFSR